MEFSKKFVCEDTTYSTYEKNVPAPLFRKSFYLDSPVSGGEILICGLGFYDLFINGQKITKGYLAPYISNSDHYTYFDRYNLAPYLTEGENVIGVMLGDGFQNGKTVTWDFRHNHINSAPLLALSAEIICDDKSISFDASDFVCKKGPILFNDMRSGVFYDARLEEAGWSSPGFTETGWHSPIQAATPPGTAKICEAEPIKVYREIKPVSITKGGRAPHNYVEQDSLVPFEEAAQEDGGYIYDFGENNAGIFRLKIKGKKGQKISIQCAEQFIDGKADYSRIYFYPDGFAQRDIYYLKGEGEEIFEPMFTYHGYQYLYVTGITEEQATEDLLTYLVMSSDLEERGTFECSDELLSKIYDMCRRSDISNFYYFPTDCPHREKNGWTGDAAASAEHIIMTIGAENSWREWLHNIRRTQLENGMLPGIIPTENWGYDWGNGPAWDCVIFVIPYFVYKYRGDTQIIRENAAAMLRYLEYIAGRRDGRGLVEVGLGDWCPSGRENYEADLGYTDSVMVLDMCRKASVMFDAVNLPLHKAFADSLGSEMLSAIRREYIDPDTLVVKNRCQTSQAMAIYYDVFTEEEKKQGFNVLLDIIEEDSYHLTSGLLGLRVLFHVLSDFGQAEIAYKIITKEDSYSYRYYAEKGFTTLPEQFAFFDRMYPWSKNHHFLGDISNWFMSAIGGLRVQDSGYVKINPCFLKALEWCRTTHSLPGGNVEISWKRTDGKIELKVACSDSIKCEIIKNSHLRYTETGKNTYLIEE